MKLVDDTPMRVGWMPWCFAPGDWRLVVVVKATLELAPAAMAHLADEQVFVTGDQFWDDDPDRSVRYDGDLALLKPAGEMWLTGTVRVQPPRTELACSARVGGLQTRFSVVGDRWWSADGVPTPPIPFEEMELSWERCFGGTGFEANPMGRGLGVDPSDELGRVSLPNIEAFDELVRAPGQRPPPASFGPVPKSWPERARWQGREYGSDYLRERWPYFAEDFRWRYFQASREPLRLPEGSYWRGDEVIELGGLHPEHASVRCALPGLRPRVFVHEPDVTSEPLREVGLVLDTVVSRRG